ncbi:MAG: hypothetical protein K2X81_25430 [Candidatus Obscuribacterales bacterium]|nr:hypothetical protein [Candidatus Obscuribacterales bacterium]
MKKITEILENRTPLTNSIFQRRFPKNKELPAQIMEYPHICALILLDLYLKPDIVYDAEALHQLEDSPRPSFKTNLARLRLRFKSYLLANSKLSFLKLLPSLLVVLWFMGLDLIAPYVLRRKWIWASWQFNYLQFENDFADGRWARDLMLDLRPLFMSWSCLAPPIAIVLMLTHFWSTITEPLRKIFAKKESETECFRFSQSLDGSAEVLNHNFQHWPWFNLVASLPFLLGVPAAISTYLYFNLGVDELLGRPSTDA